MDLNAPVIRSAFTFSPFTSDVCTGRFSVDDVLVRHAFAYLNIDCVGLYGLRSIRADGSVVDVGLMDPRRCAFEKFCKTIGEGSAGLDSFHHLIPRGEGLVVNSPQTPDQQKNPFNSLAQLFLTGAGYATDCSPEAIDMNLFIGSYDRSFAVHRDAEDTALFVLDGRKHFQVGLQENSLQEFVVKRGEYLRWRSIHWHGNINPLNEWSVTVNFAVGPAGWRMIPAGTPVTYGYAETKMNDYQQQMIAMQAKSRGK